MVSETAPSQTMEYKIRQRLQRSIKKMSIEFYSFENCSFLFIYIENTTFNSNTKGK